MHLDLFFFRKAHLKNPIQTPKNTLFFLWKIYYEVNSKISSTLVQLTVIVFNQQKKQQRNFKDFKKEKSYLNSLRKFYW